jgi:hypothetical protein
MMDIDDFPGCCTAVVLSCLYSDATLEHELMDAIANHEDNLITAITTSGQIFANRLLRRYGFKRTSFKKKPMGEHPETEIALWWRSPNLK